MQLSAPSAHPKASSVADGRGGRSMTIDSAVAYVLDEVAATYACMPRPSCGAADRRDR